ncbi:uncharacterized mitochondrial g00660-like [Olea europaea subsp. europaea]|uniref:Uncharacterized mitochondrial g00660-like n=1 Tax=Olea europaea subsp. europaea TaxID=158383 RepID=A0A8S0RK34_OLEEU|nr:uncharacterized mitochondrial g00660-like [Olea europaea subsp. europaea]
MNYCPLFVGSSDGGVGPLRLWLHLNQGPTKELTQPTLDHHLREENAKLYNMVVEEEMCRVQGRGKTLHFTRARRGSEPYCGRDASRAKLLEMSLFSEAKSISGHQTLQLMKRPYGVKGSVYVVTLLAFQRCLEDGLDTAER